MKKSLFKVTSVILGLSILFSSLPTFAATINPADRDTTFDAGTLNGFNTTVNSSAVQSDGKILVAGNFGAYQWVAANYIIRLNADWSRDSSFNIGNGFDSIVYSVRIQSDGKILVGGYFTTYQWVAANKIIRLNTDGSRDSSFNIGNGFNNTVSSMAIQTDGKILVGGYFTTYQWVAVNRVIRLNADGSKDSSFDMGNGFNGSVEWMVIQTDGKMVAGGYFTTYQWVAANNIIRLNVDGSRDSSFNIGNGFNTLVKSFSIQPDGKIVAGGSFSSYQWVSAYKIIRLNTDGSRDSSFNIGNGFDSYVSSFISQLDWKIILFWDFSTYQWIPANRIIRLNTDGARDSTFNVGNGFAGLNGVIYTLAAQADGKILVGGQFTTYQWVSANKIIRLNADGSRDSSFSIGNGFNSTAQVIAVQTDGKILVGGQFTTYNWITAKYLIRLNSDGSIDSSFNSGAGFNNTVYSIVIQTDGKILIGGYFTTYNWITAKYLIRLNSDGSIDSSFNSGAGFNALVYGLALQSDGKIVVGGGFTSYQWITANRIIRLNSDWSRDTSLNNVGVGFDTSIYTLVVQSDGKIVAGGNFNYYQWSYFPHLIRLNTDGSRDTSFNNVGIYNDVNSLLLQIDGKIIVGGCFAPYYMFRLNSDGSKDSSFDMGSGINGWVLSLVFQDDGSILVGGYFWSYNWVAAWNLLRLKWTQLPSGALPVFLSDTQIIAYLLKTKKTVDPKWLFMWTIPLYF